jgi:hypothetical protein
VCIHLLFPKHQPLILKLEKKTDLNFTSHGRGQCHISGGYLPASYAAARVQSQVSSYEFSGGRSGSRERFLRVLWFPLQILIQPSATLFSSISWVWHDCPLKRNQVLARVRSCGICGGQSGAGVGFLRVLRFPLPIFIPPIAPQSSSSIIRSWYNRPVVAAVPSGLGLTPPHETNNNNNNGLNTKGLTPPQ